MVGYEQPSGIVEALRLDWAALLDEALGAVDGWIARLVAPAGPLAAEDARMGAATLGDAERAIAESANVLHETCPDIAGYVERAGELAALAAEVSESGLEPVPRSVAAHGLFAVAVLELRAARKEYDRVFRR
ncbi:hypothetical protein ACIPRL_07960 [Streptomyces sp. NPDC090085]|uniref:hypothetical protein n=1 Tax=Streptomyces sp. NPDC090085 TaxID=3365943 RepID=UPI003826C30B